MSATCTGMGEKRSPLGHVKAFLKSPPSLAKLKQSFTEKSEDDKVQKALNKATDLISQAEVLLRQADRTTGALFYKVSYLSCLMQYHGILTRNNEKSMPVGVGYGRPWIDQWRPSPLKGFGLGLGRGRGRASCSFPVAPIVLSCRLSWPRHVVCLCIQSIETISQIMLQPQKFCRSLALLTVLSIMTFFAHTDALLRLLQTFSLQVMTSQVAHC